MSTLTKKYLMALTGLGLVGFLVMHLAGNLTLLVPRASLFNDYAHKLHELGLLLIVLEIGLLLMFVVHVITALSVSFQKRSARGDITYKMVKPKSWSESKNNFASRNMIISGIIVLVFLIWHLIQFKYGPGIEEGLFVENAHGEPIRDLHSLVVESFRQTWVVVLYIFSLIALGFHLRHGFWSAFQSLGIAFPQHSKCLHTGALLLAIIIAGGFILIPICIYFNLLGVFS